MTNTVNQKAASNLNNERLGLTMIAASLIVIGLIIGAHLWQQKNAQEAQIRVQGVGLARALTGLSFQQLVPDDGQASLLKTIFQSQNDPSFAYAAIVDSANRPVSLAAAPGIAVPPLDWPKRHVGWLSDRVLTTSDGANVIEFFAPLYNDGSIGAYLHLGYFLPGVAVSFQQLPFFATLALIIFLLTPLFYFMVRHEIRPLRQASENITEIIDSQKFRHVEVHPSGEFGDFLGRFNAFVDAAGKRIGELEQEQERLLTSQKLIAYSKTRIETVLESIPEAVMILNQTGGVSFANRRVESLLGVSHEDVLETDISVWCDDAALLDVVNGYSGDCAASYLSETVRLDITNNKRRKLAVKAYPLFSPAESSEIHGSLIVFRDVTKDADAQRQQGEFISHVAHELKTPLNTLAMYSELLIGDDGDDKQVRIESANIIHDEVERLAGLIDNLLSITRIDSGDISIDRKRLRLRDLLEDAFDTIKRGENAAQVTFELDLPAELSSILADKELLRIALNNLLTNAVKYSRAGGVVSLVCEETEQTIQIFVRDTGLGIAPAEIDHIFDRFYRSGDEEVRKRSGHGLGLSLARDIIQLHHGTLNVDSTPGEGSEFAIEIWKESELLQQAI